MFVGISFGCTNKVTGTHRTESQQSGKKTSKCNSSVWTDPVEVEYAQSKAHLARTAEENNGATLRSALAAWPFARSDPVLDQYRMQAEHLEASAQREAAAQKGDVHALRTAMESWTSPPKFTRTLLRFRLDSR